MEWLTKAWEWFNGGNGLIVIAALLGISEVLALIPQLKSNSVFQAIINGIKWIKEKLSK